MKSLYHRTKTRFTPSELNSYLKEDYTDNLPYYLKPIGQEIGEVSNEHSEFDLWLKDQTVTRKLKYLVMHCTATVQTAKVASIINYWKNTMKWKSPGYHIIIKPTGEYTILSDLQDITNGVAGYNSQSIHISYIGGVDEMGRGIDNRTQEQKDTINYFQGKIQQRFNLELKGHRDFPNVAKECPSYNVKEGI